MEIMNIFKKAFERKRKGDSLSYVSPDGKESNSLLHWEIEQDIPDNPERVERLYRKLISLGASEETARRMTA
jgi:hypothetical protein